MVDPRLPSNPTAMLMQAQERKHLVNKLINLKCNVDKGQPKQFNHLSSGRINRRNDEVRKINAENQQMLNKIMNIMNRKPTGNGLNGVPLRKNVSNHDILGTSDPQNTSIETFQGNQDIKLIQPNAAGVEPTAQLPGRFQFEINPTAIAGQNPGANPFKTSNDSQRKVLASSGIVDTQPLNSPDAAQKFSGAPLEDRFKKNDYDAANNMELIGETEKMTTPDQEGQEHRLESVDKKISPSQSHSQYQKIQSSVMFDKRFPQTESENKIGQNSKITVNPFSSESEQQAAQKAREGQPMSEQINPTSEKPADFAVTQEETVPPVAPVDKKLTSLQANIGKKLYPAQITLNHT